MHKKTLKLTLWTTFRFGVHSALYPNPTAAKVQLSGALAKK